MGVLFAPRGVLLPLAARTANPADSLILNQNGLSKLRMVVHMTAVTATGTVTVSVYSRSSSGVLTLLLASAALSAVADTVLFIGLGATAAANLVANIAMGREIIVQVVHGNGVSMTYSIDYDLLP